MKLLYRAMCRCHPKFTVRNATAGLAVNDFNWLLTATFFLRRAPNQGRPAKPEEGSLGPEKH